MGRTLLTLTADSGPVVVLAVIAAAGSFTHIRDTATEHGQHGWMAWAIAICIDLTCVMAARERQRDARTGRRTGLISWPTLVLTGGILLSLAANLAQAHPSLWGWITAAIPAGAFLVAVSMLERRSTTPTGVEPEPSLSERLAPPPSWGRPDQDEPSPAVPVPSPPVPLVSPDAPALDRPQDDITSQNGASGDETTPGNGIASGDGTASRDEPEQDEAEKPPGPAPQLLAYARQIATDHHTQHGRPITRDLLRARLGVSNQLASDLLRHIRT